MAEIFIVLGALFLAALAADTLGRRTRVPRVTLLLLLGLAVGEGGLGLVSNGALPFADALSTIALTMVAFLLGGTLRTETLRAHGRAILWLSAGIVLATVAVVTGGLLLLGVAAPLAILAGAIATATDPAATQEVLREHGAETRFTLTLRGVVAVDDAWGMIVFALALVAAQALGGEGMSLDHLWRALWELGGALALGLALGLPGAVLTGRVREGEPQQVEALGLVFLTAGLALWLDVSYLLAGMTAGAVIVNRALHHDYAFHEIERIEWPFLALFFLLAGATLDLAALWAIGGLGLAYVVLRIAGRLLGGWLGGRLGGLDARESQLSGAALLSQAGVAVGMALVAAQDFPEAGEILLSLAIGTTVIFEVIGPLTTAWALRRLSRSATP
ncbi:sodium:proton antiporter [Pseudoponticoccus marisrubri]|uniref:Sodium:proton antiporter n=1 Tax=Pseudoponticoccus marisrubri TaxID=1685382 RepID=A0A0W7WII2_9RHOB|nr:sodium:proton antiporter [Pseudoponticoccus marisrubri]